MPIPAPYTADMSLLKKYAHASLNSLLAKAATIFGALGVIWLTNHILDKHDFGLFMLAFTVTGMLSMVLASPFFALVLYKVSPLAEDGKTDPIARNIVGKSLILSMLVGIIGAALLLLTAFELGDLMDKPGIVFWFEGLALILPLDIGRLVLSFWYRARQDIALSVFYQETLPNILRCTFLVLAWLFDAHAPGVIAAMLMAQIIPLVLLYVRDPVWPKWRDKAFAKGDVSYGLQNMLTQVVNEPTRSLDLIFLGLIVSASRAADYALAARLSRLLLVPRQALSQLIVPRFGPLLKANDIAHLKLEYDAIRMLSLLTGLGGCAFVLLLGPFILSLFGDYHSALPLLILLCYAQIVVCGYGNNSGLLGIAGLASWVLMTGIVSTLIVLVGGLLMASLYGAIGMALAVVMANAVLFGLLIYPCWKLLKLPTMNIPTIMAMLVSGILCGAAAANPHWHVSAGALMTVLFAVYAGLDDSALRFFRAHKLPAKTH